MKRIITIELTHIYEFDEERYPIDKYNEDAICDIAYEWWHECEPDIFIELEEDKG